MNGFKSGFVSLTGRPNVGKSTLLNSLVGEKLAIISQKPQTTRNKIQGILTKADCQIIFIDTPGIHRPKHRLGEIMVKAAKSAMSDVDVILFLISAADKLTSEDRYAAESFERIKTPVFLVINKTDKTDKTDILEITESANALYSFARTIPISAMNGDNVDVLLEEITKILPEGPQYFPDDIATDQPERFIAAEMIREKALQYLQDEIPHGIAVEIFSMKKRGERNLIDIEANIFCEKESHKGIVIGKNGDILKKVGIGSRIDIERLLGSPVNLQLWVKVKKDWRDNDYMARTLGNL